MSSPAVRRTSSCRRFCGRCATARPRRCEGSYTLLLSTANDLYLERLTLPEQERLRLVERVIHDLADAARRRNAATPPGTSVIGLWADEPEAVDEVVEGAMREREARRLRTNGDAAHNG